MSINELRNKAIKEMTGEANNLELSSYNSNQEKDENIPGNQMQIFTPENLFSPTAIYQEIDLS